MIKYTPSIVIFGLPLFFSLLSIVGYGYAGKEETSIYIIFNVVLFVVSIMLFVQEFFIKKNKFHIYHLLLLTIPIVFTFNLLISILFMKINDEGINSYLYFILWGLPAILMGIYVSINSRIKYLERFIDIIILVLSFGIINAMIDSLITETRINIGGGSYQYASYIAAFAYGLNLYYLLFGKHHCRFKFAKSKVYKFLLIILLPLQVLGVIVSGGRGGMVLVIVYTIYIISKFFYRKITIKSMVHFYLVFFGAVILILMFLPKILEISIVQNSFNRLFSYLSVSGINWSGTSGRDIVYQESISLIYESPILGYGIFGMWNALGYYPHNIILEILLQGGLIYLTIFLIIFTFMFSKLKRLLKEMQSFHLVTIIMLYPLIMLLFSGTYTNNSLFWFCFSLIISQQRNYIQS